MQISSKFAIFPRFVDSTNYLPTQVTLTLAKNVRNFLKVSMVGIQIYQK